MFDVHYLDMLITVLYKKSNANLTLGNYRLELAETLRSHKKYDRNKRARPSNLQNINIQKHIWADGRSHGEKSCGFKNRCKFPSCPGFLRLSASNEKLFCVTTKIAIALLHFIHSDAI